jgi:hypothetical protein
LGLSWDKRMGARETELMAEGGSGADKNPNCIIYGRFPRHKLESLVDINQFKFFINKVKIYVTFWKLKIVIKKMKYY